MSIGTQEALRSNYPSEQPPPTASHVPEERYAYDPEHPYVFGDVGQFKQDGSVGKLGTVFARYPIEPGVEIANVVYVNHLEPLYFVPAAFFRPSQETMDYYQLSNSQRRKRTESYSILDVVVLGTQGIDVSWVMRASRNFSRKLNYYSTKGFFGLETNAVISSEQFRKLWTEEFGLVSVQRDIDTRLIQERIPNLVYKTVFRLVPIMKFDQMFMHNVRLNEHDLFDGYKFTLEEMERVEEAHHEIVYQAPWNHERVDPARYDYKYHAEDDFDVEEKRVKKHGKSKLVEVLCVVLTENELFSADVDKCVMAPTAHDFPHMVPGNILWARLLFSEMNDFYVALGAYPDERCSQVPTEREASGRMKFLISVEIDPTAGPYLNGGAFGLIADPRYMLPYANFLESHGVPQVWVVRETSPDQVCSFSIVAVPANQAAE